jgi:uncharacterized membrane protein YdjX (TVP38/TMEM64 family)
VTPSNQARGSRLGWAVAAIVLLYLLAQASGLHELLGAERLRALVGRAGPWGPVVFVAIFVGGVLAQIPGIVFVSAAPVLFPIPLAWALCLVAGNIAVNANFAVVRRIGGENQVEFERPWAQRLFDQLERRPLWAVGLLRASLLMFPPLTGALALTRLNPRDHALGSALGLALPISAIVWLEALLMW